MTKTFHFRISMQAAAVLILHFFVIGSLHADEKKHLPAKAKEVAEKFEAFKKTATPADTAAKRKQVITYLGNLLKEEAAKANLDGALAVKSLIEEIEKGSPQPVPLVPKRAIAPQLGKAEGLPHEKFAIDSEKKRRLEFSFFVAKDRRSKSIRCEVDGASDDSGDRGLDFELIDPDGAIAKQGKLTSSGIDLVVHKTNRGGEWKIVFVDDDTVFSGVHPGNNASVRVTVIRPQASLATSRPAR